MAGTWLKALAAAVTAAVALAGCMDGGDDGPAEPEGPGQATLLTFEAPVDLECPSDNPLYLIWDLAYTDCGNFGEPQLEVAGDGTIWYSAVCCVGQAPPIWRSFDGGVAFVPLDFGDGTGVVRDAFGIEGDFAIDDAGNVYFFDIAAATGWFTKFSAHGAHLHTKPDVFPPLVDRPWVRAGAADEVFILYNTGMSSRFFRSTDGGLTWDYPGSTEFPCGLMTLGQGGERHQLAATGCAGAPMLYRSDDAGATWDGGTGLPVPDGYGPYESYMAPAGDANGSFYVPVTHTIDDGAHTVVSVYRVDPDGSVAGPWQVTPSDGLAEKPWMIAGKDGVAAFAYFQAEQVARDNETTDAVWHVQVAYTSEGLTDRPTWTTVRADPQAVLEGSFGRELGDFLEARQTPDGRIAIAYGARPGSPDAPIVNRFVQSAVGIDLGPAVFRNGPAP